MLKQFLALIAVSLLMMAAGCTVQDAPPSQAQVLPHEIIKIDPALAEKAKETATTIPGVVDSTAIAYDQNVSVGIKVTGFDRLRLKSIREEVHQKIKSANQNIDLHVSSDKKLFRELQLIEEQIKTQNLPPTDIARRAEEINKKM